MTRKSRWETKETKDGTWIVELSSWRYFHDYVRQEMLDFSYYVWRGQRCSTWFLESSLDRSLKKKKKIERPDMADEHLQSFKYAVRGRRGPNPPELKDDNDWFALGQHYGLATPLLDWTHSPFVALYFAFAEEEVPKEGFRAVYALNEGVTRKEEHIIKNHNESTTRPPIIEFIKPLSNDNSRLVNQAGLFTRVPLGQTVDDWIKVNFKNEPAGDLIKIIIPDKERNECLRTLNRMNINHLTLFPDLYGASEYCNMVIRINKY